MTAVRELLAAAIMPGAAVDATDVDPNDLLYEAVRERVTLQLARGLRSGPKELIDYLRLHRERVGKLNLLLAGESRRAMTALVGAGIEAEVLDGPDRVSSVYGGLGEAECEAVIGVPDSDEAMAVLATVGFRRAGADLVRSGFDAVLRIRGPGRPIVRRPDESSLGAFEPSPPEVVEAMLDLADVGRGDTVADLGCGDGRVLIAATRRGAHAIGYETDPALVGVARGAGQTVFDTDASLADLLEATVVTLYVTLEAGLRMQPSLKSIVARGGRVVAHHFDLGLWPCTKEIVVQAGEARRHVRLWTAI